MNPDFLLEKNRRRTRIIVTYLIYVFIAYLPPIIATAVAKIFSLTPILWTTILFLLLGVIILTLLSISITLVKKNISIAFATKIYSMQFVAWSILYAIWIFNLHEIRAVGLLFAIMSMAFLLSRSNLIQSLIMAISITIIQISITSYAIFYANQEGSFGTDILFAISFLPAAIFISYVAGKFEQQRNEIKKMKKEAEEVRDALWGEMELARKIQTSLLPEQPSISGYEISAYMKPADLVGGNYYDIINVGGKDWIAIGDVSGHGVLTGLIMMMVQTSIKAILAQHPDLDPSQLLIVINSIISENIRKLSNNKYMTITILAAHDNGKFYFSGLHQDIMIYRARTGNVELLETRGIWLGVMDDINGLVKDDIIHMELEDVMMIYTDGITEAKRKGSFAGNRNSIPEIFGADHLIDIFSRTGIKELPLIKEAILKELDQFTCDDDITIVLIKRTG